MCLKLRKVFFQVVQVDIDGEKCVGGDHCLDLGHITGIHGFLLSSLDLSLLLNYISLGILSGLANFFGLQDVFFDYGVKHFFLRLRHVLHNVDLLSFLSPVNLEQTIFIKANDIYCSSFR